MIDLKDWKKLSEPEKLTICLDEDLSGACLREIWSKLTKLKKDYICCYRAVPRDFVSEKWDELTNSQRVCSFS